MFFTQPKIKRIGLHLESTIAETCRTKWSEYLTTVSSHENIDYHKHIPGKDELNNAEIFGTPEFFREKEHFSWTLLFDEDTTTDNIKGQYRFYALLLEDVRQLNAELEKQAPDYNKIIDIVKSIKGKSVAVPSIKSGDGPITIQAEDWDMGGNLFFDFFVGIYGAIHAVIMALEGVVLAIPYGLSYSQYCGGPEFFIDTVIYFCESIRKLTFSVMFPLGMLYSAYTTDSYNPFTKGGVSRSLDGIIALANAALADETCDDDFQELLNS